MIRLVTSSFCLNLQTRPSFPVIYNPDQQPCSFSDPSQGYREAATAVVPKYMPSRQSIFQKNDPSFPTRHISASRETSTGEADVPAQGCDALGSSRGLSLVDWQRGSGLRLRGVKITSGK
ncbi:hypothetical protein PGTUg99_004534 [Puccinia graminis f. sp. tritici]|uniref:Uncharacterized protein n=1 Tax=Puccinia graminis f. sp. tritici TaxID=56615 RepID=A0A5B0MMK4_PUCGR|nr:hypothetical protein PGTUg99_004534 [Puccinia graminis f. sp. tritici]